jgi:hypothetical protein
MGCSAVVSAVVRAVVSPLSRERRSRVIAGVVLVPILMAGGVGASAAAATRAQGFAVHDFVTGLPTVPPPSFFAGIGPFGLAFNGADHLLVSEAANQGFYSFGPNGSSAPSPITTGNVQTGLAFTKNGELFAARYQAGNIDEVAPASGAFIRHLNPPGTTYPCIAYLATDPISGDLFFGEPNSGGACPGNAALTRVENPTSAHPTFVSYSALPGNFYVGLTFGPDGTLYAVQQASNSACAVRISGTSSPQPPTITTIACFPNFENMFIGIDPITLSARPEGDPTLFVAGPGGTITKIDQSTTPPTLTPIVTLPTRIDDLVVGPDGCLYATQSTAIDKITNADGQCAPSSPQGTIVATTFKRCNTLHVGYNRFVNATIVHWTVTTNGVGTVASGQFSAIGGGKLGSKTYHFLDIPLGTTLPPEASGIQSHVLFTWATGGTFYATRDPGC